VQNNTQERSIDLKSAVVLNESELSGFYLLAYYDEAVLHNTPYDAPGFGFREIAAILASELAANSHPFDKVFLYSPREQPTALQVWPPL